MSKIGKKPILLPSGVTIGVSGTTLTVKGPKGTLTRELPAELAVVVTDNVMLVKPAAVKPDRAQRAQWGLWHALVANMLTGASEGWQESLEFQGIGYKAVVKGSDLELSLGYSHPVTVSAPPGITFTVEKSTIKVTGADKEAVGHVAALIRSKRLPEPYKGSGIRYSDEIIKKKAGKKAATAA